MTTSKARAALAGQGEEEEFLRWCHLGGHDAEAAGELWKQQKGGNHVHWRLTHFNHEDILCGCDPQCSHDDAMLSAECPKPVLSTGPTRHFDSFRNLETVPPPRPTMKPGRPGSQSKARQGPFTHSLQRGQRQPHVAMPPLPPPPPRSTQRTCRACQGSKRLAHTCAKKRGASARRMPAAATTPTADHTSSAGFGSGSAGRHQRPDLLSPLGTPTPTLQQASLGEGKHRGTSAAAASGTAIGGERRAKNKATADGWLSKRHRPPEPDANPVLAKKARQRAARLQEVGRALDPGNLPPQLFASTFWAAVELMHVVTEHTRACEGTFMPRERMCATHGLVGAMSMRCSKHSGEERAGVDAASGGGSSRSQSPARRRR